MPPQILDDIHQHARIIRPQIGEVSRLAEMHLDRDKFILEVDLINARRQNQPRQLLNLVFPECRMKIRKIDLCRLHKFFPFLFVNICSVIAKLLYTFSIQKAKKRAAAAPLAFLFT